VAGRVTRSCWSSPRPADAVRFGLAIKDAAGAEPMFPALHIGAHHGPVLYRDGDYVGGGVNLAARIASAAAGDESVVGS
jgi:adenylate cyclase